MPKRANLPFVEGPTAAFVMGAGRRRHSSIIFHGTACTCRHATGTRYTHYTITALYINIYKYIYIRAYIWAAGGHVRRPKYRPRKRPDEQHFVYIPGSVSPLLLLLLPPPPPTGPKIERTKIIVKKKNNNNNRPRTTGLSFDYYWCRTRPTVKYCTSKYSKVREIMRAGRLNNNIITC